MVLPDSIWVEIKQVHFDNGSPGCHFDCPIALAILDLFPQVERAWVCSGVVTLYKRDRKVATYSLPIEAGHWIFAFDRDCSPPLISFEMTLL